MVQGHTLDAVLREGSRHGLTFDIWNRTRGMTSVTFLLVSGLTYVMTLPSEVAAPRNVVRRRLRRALLLIVLGYTLRAPLWAMFASRQIKLQAMHDFWIIDILQCIGVSLALTIALQAATRTMRGLRSAATAMVVLFFFVNPVVLQSTFARWPTAANNYLGPINGSLFPLFPWSGYFFVGVSLGAWLRIRGRLPNNLGYSLPLVVVACTSALLAWRMQTLSSLTSSFIWLQSEPFFRVFCVLVAAMLVWLLTRNRKSIASIWVELGSHTLAIYYLHVLLVYAPHVGLKDVIGRTLSPGIALALAAVVLTLSFAAARGWDALWARVRSTH